MIIITTPATDVMERAMAMETKVVKIKAVPKEYDGDSRLNNSVKNIVKWTSGKENIREESYSDEIVN